MGILNIILMLGTVIAAAAVSFICLVGLVVWLAGGKSSQSRDEKTV